MRIIFLILMIAVLVTACAPSISPADQPVNNQTPQPPVSPDYLPRPGDDKLTRGEVFLDSTDLLTMESYPLQFALTLTGNLPTPCHQLRVQVDQPDTSGMIPVDVYSVVDPTVICAQVLQPFSLNVPLGSFPAGHYRLLVNGQPVAEFDA
jgi:hypothetical protein